MRILLTRPEHDARRTAATLREMGHEVIVAPLLRIEAASDADLGAEPCAAIIITSANAARAIASNERYYELRHIPVYAVGERSAETMRIAGFSDVTSADGNVEDLARLVAERMEPGSRLLYLAGAERSADLGRALAGFTVHTAVIYRAVIVENLPLAAVDALAGGIDGVLHFSRRTADAYVSAVGAAGVAELALQGPIHFCLSAGVAEPLLRAGATKVRIAARPDEAALIALVAAT